MSMRVPEIDGDDVWLWVGIVLVGAVACLLASGLWRAWNLSGADGGGDLHLSLQYFAASAGLFPALIALGGAVALRFAPEDGTPALASARRVCLVIAVLIGLISVYHAVDPGGLNGERGVAILEALAAIAVALLAAVLSRSGASETA